MKYLLLPAICALPCFLQAQMLNDTLETYEFRVAAYGHNRDLQSAPAAISYISPNRLRSFNNMNILPALNTAPGVRMEERSPGSYRLSIRGSSLRSPFGVRNIKIYYNDIPFTDPGGHSYLNQLGFYNFHSVEIIKGPGSSMYGAGTGGVMLVNSLPEYTGNGATVAYTAGSYAMHSILGEARFGTQGLNNTVRYQHQESEGYRRHSALRRDVLSWDTRARLSDRDELSAHFLYGDLFYQTPGALTLEEYQADPRQARPSVPLAPGFTLPGAVEMKASIREQTFLAGLTLKHRFSSRFENKTTAYGAYTQLRNPTVRNYGRSSEPHAGLRTSFRYDFQAGQSRFAWTLGAEGQQGFTSVRIYQSLQGTPDTLQTDDELHVRQYFAFTQLNWEFRKLLVSAGLSLNRMRVSFTRFSSPPATEYVRDFSNQLAPRLALLYRLKPNLSIYGSASKGFSPPTSAELSPSGGVLNATLEAEEGWNYEAGIRGNLLKGRLQYDVNAFYFNLDNTIVLRRDSLSGDFFVNAGSTRQTGIESWLRYQALSMPRAPVSAQVWLSYTWYHFRYREFMQLEYDFSGNQLPSVAPHTLAAGIDLMTGPGIYANLTYYYSDRIALDDANSAFADPYNLVGLRIGYRTTFRNRYTIDVFAGGDNLLNQTYSLGNDINGFGGRYYNAAPDRNYYAGVQLRFDGR